MGTMEWLSDESQRRAAWELYVELVTRVSVQPLDLDHGLAREALTSLHALFGVTREILRRHGPGVGAVRESVGGIAIAVLNQGVRPFLAKWHPALLEWEETRRPGCSVKTHERNWDQEPMLRGELEKLRNQLGKYAKALGKIANVF